MNRFGTDSIDFRTRSELIEKLMELKDTTPIKVTETWLREQTTEKLQILVLAASLYRTLRTREAIRRCQPEQS
jgi:hypothetical protein